MFSINAENAEKNKIKWNN